MKVRRQRFDPIDAGERRGERANDHSGRGRARHPVDVAPRTAHPQRDHGPDDEIHDGPEHEEPGREIDRLERLLGRRIDPGIEPRQAREHRKEQQAGYRNRECGRRQRDMHLVRPRAAGQIAEHQHQQCTDRHGTDRHSRREPRRKGVVRIERQRDGGADHAHQRERGQRAVLPGRHGLASESRARSSAGTSSSVACWLNCSALM